MAHPWALKSPVSVIRGLKAAGLHAVEVYRSDGKVSGTVLEYFRRVCFLGMGENNSLQFFFLLLLKK